MTLAAILFVSVMINLANYPGEIDDESPLSNTGESSNLPPDWSYCIDPLCRTTAENFNDVAISANGDFIVAGSEKNLNGGEIFFFVKHSEVPFREYEIGVDVTSVDISDNGDYFVAVAESYIVYLFEKTSSTPLWTFDAYRESKIAISGNGEYIVVGTADGHNSRIHLFSMSSNSPIWTYTAGGDIRTVAISDDGEYITAGGNSDMVYIFNKNSGTPLHDYNAGGDVLSVSISGNSHQIIVGSINGIHMLFREDVGILNIIWVTTTGNEVNKVEISKDGEYIVAATGNNSQVSLFKSNNPTPIWIYQAPELTGGTPTGAVVRQISDLAISGNGNYIVAGDNDGDVILFDKNSSIPLSITHLDYSYNNPVLVSISEDGRHIVAGGIASGVHKFTTDYGGPIDYEIEWHPYSEVWGGNLDPAMKLEGPPGIGIIAPPCADDSDLCQTSTTVSVTLERPATQMHIQFGVSKGSSYEESPGNIGTFFYVQNHTTNVWDNVYTQWGLRAGGTWEVITLTPLHYDEEHTVNISFTVKNYQTGQVGSVIGSWQAVFFYESMDRDGDGVFDSEDAFPNDPQESVDSDGDGVGDIADLFLLDPTEWLDSDIDGVGDNTDAFPLDSTEWIDSDGDGFGDNTDAFPLDSTEWLDSDFDRVGDNADLFPLDPTEWLDSDADGVGDNSDTFPDDPTRIFDNDGDGISKQEEGVFLDRLPQQYVVIVIAICLIIAQTSLWWFTLWIRQERQ